MTGASLIAVLIQVVSAIVVMILVLLQKLKEGDGITANNPNSNTSGMGMSRENRLSRLTVIFGIIFAVASIVASTILVRSI